MTKDASFPFSSLVPDVAAFLRHMSDPSSTENALSFAYAAKVILPATAWPEEDLISFLVSDLNRPHNLRTLAQAQARLGREIYAPFSFSLTAASGDPVSFLALPRPGVDEKGAARIYISLAAQGPRAKRFSSKLDNNSPFLRLLDVLPTYVIIIDKDYSVLFSNRVARQLFGLVEGKTCHLLSKNINTPCQNCPPFRVFSTSSLVVHDWHHVRSDSTFRAYSYPFETTDGSRHILQIGINITEGVRAQNALDLSEQRYRSIADNLAMGLALVDPAFYTITLNPKMEEWFGPGAAKGARLDRFFAEYGNEAGTEAARLLTAAVTEKKNQEGEFSLSLPTGEGRHFRLVACPILTRMSVLRAIVVMLEDVTDNRNLALRMQQMQRLEALGSLAAGIAHEINQPLSALRLYASGLLMMLETGVETPPDRIMERLALILSQADKIRQIVNHMRALVLQEKNPPVTAVSLAKAAEGALGLVGAQLRDHNIRVAGNIPATVPPVAANDVMLEQVIINLLVNAMHALDTVEGREKHIRITAETAGDSSVALSIRDNGPGVGALQSRIFDPFFTTKEPDKGMGLGLSIVHAFVSGWGGSVSVASNPDGPGTTFTVLLPSAGET